MSYQIAKPVSEKPVGLTGSEINDYIFKIKKNTGNIRVQIERIRNSDKDFDYNHCCELHKNPSSSIAVGIAHVKYSGFDNDSDMAMRLL